MSEVAVLNANYLLARLRDAYELPFDRLCMHEFVLSARPLKREHGVTALDVAKRLMDYGFHPPTVYFPLIVPEALMIEPTETETKETLDAFADAMLAIAEEAAEEPERAEERRRTAAPVGRLDEVKAVKRVVVRYGFEEHPDLSGEPAEAARRGTERRLMIDLRSDTKTQPSAEMRAAIAAAEVGDEQRREDPTVNELEPRVAELLGQEEAVFVPTATMANEIALRTLGERRATRWSPRRTRTSSSRSSAARPCIAGLMTRQLPCPNGRFTPEQLRDDRSRQGDSDAHATDANRLGREHPQRLRVAASGRSRRSTRSSRPRASSAFALHLDGARVLNAARRLRCPGGARSARPVRHGHALSLEGPRLSARGARSPARPS